MASPLHRFSLKHHKHFLTTSSTMLSGQILVRGLPRASRGFHFTARAMVKAGDSIPNIDLFEGSPGNKVNLSEELTGKGLIIGVPAAFSQFSRDSPISQGKYNAKSFLFLGPTCSDSHIPSYVMHPKIKDAGRVFVVSVNDAFV
jgi:2-Cys peroxiredoxin 5